MPDTLPGKQRDDLTLIIGGREIFIESGTLVKTMDTGADAFSCLMPWALGVDPALDAITAPFSYSPARLFIGGKLESELILYDVTHRTSVAGTVKELAFYSKTADMIDSSVRVPFEENNVDLLQRAIGQAFEFDIDVVVDTGVEIGGRFNRVTSEPTAMCFAELAKLAAQRGLLLSCTKEGNLLITKAKPNSPPVGTIRENESPEAGEYSMSFNGRDRFIRYEAHVQSARGGIVKQRATDDKITRNRFLTFRADDGLPGEGKNAAIWRRNKTAADALALDFPVNTWYAPNGTLWQPNTTVTIISPTMNIQNGFTFLISQVQYEFNSGGSTAVLSLKPPSMYTDGDLEEPW